MQINESHKKANKVRKEIESLYNTLRVSIYKEIMAFISEFDFIEYKQPVSYDRLAYFEGATNQEALLNLIETLVTDLLEEEVSLITEHLKDVYTSVDEDTVGMWDTLKDKWSGYNYEDNLKENNHRLVVRLRREIISALSRQDSKKQILATLKKIFKTYLSGAIKILVTETTYVNNKVLVDLFEKQGYTQYMYVARLDDRTCGTCSTLHRQIFYIEEAIPGVNLPPSHSNCRCTIQKIK